MKPNLPVHKTPTELGEPMSEGAENCPDSGISLKVSASFSLVSHPGVKTTDFGGRRTQV